MDFFGDGYVELAVDQLGVAPDRVDTIIDFAAVEKFAVKAAGNADGSSATVLAELAASAAAGELDVPIPRVFAARLLAARLPDTGAAAHPRQVGFAAVAANVSCSLWSRTVAGDADPAKTVIGSGKRPMQTTARRLRYGVARTDRSDCSARRSRHHCRDMWIHRISCLAEEQAPRTRVLLSAAFFCGLMTSAILRGGRRGFAVRAFAFAASHV